MKNTKKFRISLTFICLFLFMSVTSVINVVGTDPHLYVGYQKNVGDVTGVTGKIKTIIDHGYPGGNNDFLAEWVGVEFSGGSQNHWIQLGYVQWVHQVWFIRWYTLEFYWEVMDLDGHSVNFIPRTVVTNRVYTYTIWYFTNDYWWIQIRDGPVEVYRTTAHVNTNRDSNAAEAKCEMTRTDWDIDGSQFRELKYQYNGQWEDFSSPISYDTSGRLYYQLDTSPAPTGFNANSIFQ